VGIGPAALAVGGVLFGAESVGPAEREDIAGADSDKVVGVCELVCEHPVVDSAAATIPAATARAIEGLGFIADLLFVAYCAISRAGGPPAAEAADMNAPRPSPVVKIATAASVVTRWLVNMSSVSWCRVRFPRLRWPVTQMLWQTPWGILGGFLMRSVSPGPG
jgi:hypothetical protein